MDEGAGQAEPGWYDDPHEPGRLRYYDGEVWTNHFHTEGALSDIGSWLNTTFAVYRQHWVGAAILVFSTTLIGSTVMWFGLRSILADVSVLDNELQNVDGVKIVALVGMVIFTLLWQGIGWLSLNRYVQRAHFDANPTISEAITRTLRRMPAYIATMIMIVGVGLLGLIVVSTLGAIFAPLVPVVLMLTLVGSVYLWVKMSFFAIVIAAAPTTERSVRRSFAVSDGRFVPVFGRLLLIALGLWLIALILGGTLGAVGSVIDQEAARDLVTFTEDSIEFRDFSFRELWPQTGTLIAAIVVTSLMTAVARLISTSAYVRLYLDAGGPSDL